MSANDSELARLVEELNRTANRAPHVSDKTGASPCDLDQLLALAAQRQASDLLLVANSPIAFRINGALATASSALTSSDEVRSYLQPLLTASPSQEPERSRSIDFCFMRPNIGRFRANVHYQRGSLAAAIRLLPAQIPSLDSLHLPAILAPLAERRQGFVLFTGPTGCGKTSSLAALIDSINARRRDHIITIEDPIEYEHPNRSSIVEQVEVSTDALGFADAVRSVLRQNPEVILIGEIRDAETMSAALTAAETGYLVLSSLHTNDTAQTISRILERFSNGTPAANPTATVVGAVGHHRATACPFLGRYWALPATEVMLANFAMRNLIRQGHDHQIRSQIMIARGEGMMTMDQSLGELVRANRISRETAFAHCHQPDDLRRQLDSTVV